MAFRISALTGRKADISSEEIKIVYRPEGDTKRLQEFLKKYSAIFGLLTFITPFFLVPIFMSVFPIEQVLQTVFSPIVLLLILPLTFVFSRRMCGIIFQPTHLLARPEGLFIHWQQKLGKPVKNLISWSRVTAIDVQNLSNKTKQEEQYLVFRTRSDEVTRIKLGGLVEAGGRGELLRAVRKWAPAVPRSPSVAALLEPPPDHSYTELWLTALSAPPQRELLTPLEPGALLKNGAYQVGAKIGMGGQGTAYTALCLDAVEQRPGEHAQRALTDVDGSALSESNHADRTEEQLPSAVVLKEYMLPVQVTRSARRVSLETLENEARILEGLSHPNIVALLDFFVEDHRGYLVLEYINGRSLREYVKESGRLEEGEVRRLSSQMCDILSYLHSQIPPVVHRDFTPDNLILTPAAELKLIDFNVARQISATVTATVVGKHAYIPPEQFRGKPEPRSDIYALGRTMHYLITGRDPEPLTISNPRELRADISDKLCSVVTRATQLQATARYESAEEMKRELSECV